MVWKKGESGNPSGDHPGFDEGPKWRWRDFLTDEERDTLRLCDEVKAQWKRLGGLRAVITTRGIHRAKADAARKAGKPIRKRRPSTSGQKALSEMVTRIEFVVPAFAEVANE
jgi:hypothetical protein